MHGPIARCTIYKCSSGMKSRFKLPSHPHGTVSLRTPCQIPNQSKSYVHATHRPSRQSLRKIRNAVIPPFFNIGTNVAEFRLPPAQATFIWGPRFPSHGSVHLFSALKAGSLKSAQGPPIHMGGVSRCPVHPRHLLRRGAK